MASSQRRLGDLAKVPSVSGGLRCGWHRSGAFGVSRDAPADIACDPVHGFVVIPWGKVRKALHCASDNDPEPHLSQDEATPLVPFRPPSTAEPVAESADWFRLILLLG